MKTPEEYRDKIMFQSLSSGIRDIIVQIQKDAYNQALEDAIENAECIFEERNGIEKIWIDEQSILKLKK